MSFLKTLMVSAFVVGGGGAVALCGLGPVCHPVVATAHAGDEAAAEDKTATLEIKGMTCASCGLAVKTALKKVEGFKSAEVAVKEGRARVTYDAQKTSPEELAAAVTQLGYEAKPVTE